jgi:hypothetical protein
MAKSSLNLVRENLQAYADRGVFRGLSEVKRRQGMSAFKFVWLIQYEMELSLDPDKHVLRFKKLLPGIPAGSTMYAELKSFILEWHNPALPDHRRIDCHRAAVSCSNRAGFVSISLKVKNNQYAYGVNRIVNLVHELFVYLRDTRPDYLVENFDVRQE